MVLQDRKAPTAGRMLTALSLGLVAVGGIWQAQAAQDVATMKLPASQEAQAGMAAQMLDAKTGAMAKVGTALAGLYDAHADYESRAARRVAQPAFAPADPTMRVIGGRVVIEAVAAEDTAALARDLEALGMTDASAFGRMVSGSLPIAALEQLAALDSLVQARPAMAMTLRGSVQSEGDRAMQSDLARDEEEVRGRGVRVGVLSDSYDCLGGAAADIASRDLPRARRIIVLDDTACPGSDEGRAMMQLIADVAPGARLAFHTAFNGQPDFANGIIELATDAGSDVIVDDVIFFAEPMFQDGIIAQAVDTVKDMGVAYFSSAGNGGRNAWASDGFVSSGVTGVFGGLRHDFDPGPGVDDLQSFLLGTGTTIFAFQWDQPFASVSGAPGSASDLDIILYAPGGVFIGLGGFSFNIGGDPVEVFGVVNSGPPAVFELGIELFSGPPPGRMLNAVFDPRVDTIGDPATSFFVDFPTDSGTNYGHSNAAGAAGVGAAFWRQTPRFGVSPPEVENFSSAGGTPILFDLAGNRILPEDRGKPDFVAPDGGATTFFGGRNSFGETEIGGTSFFGTSAAAPHAAGVAALMLEANDELSPDDIYEILEDTAIDMDDPSTPGFDLGFDFGTGFGLVDALAAVEEAEDFDDDDDDDDDD